LNEVRYNNLPHGDYIFKIKAANGAGAWNEEVYTVTITIHPPFWKTWWFYSLAGLCILLVIVFITRYFSQQNLKNKIAELQRLKEIDKERQRISREMHDDIGAGLTQITLMTESVKNKTTAISSKELDDITSTSRKLVSNMSEIIWSLNTENKSLDQFCAYLREELNKQLEYAGIEHTIQLPENRDDIVLSNEQRRNLLLITKEIVNNAIKYSKAKNIFVKVEYKNNTLSFEVSDNGTGFDIEKKSNGNGLHNIKQRIAELNGRIVINTSAGNGSSFSYAVKLR
jgi:signal transduction histidine kinase